MKKIQKPLNNDTVTVKSRSFEIFWRQYRKNKGAMIGLVVFVLIILISIFANFYFDYDTDIVGVNASQRLQAPSWAHPFGTDNMGRDQLARVCYGAQYSLLIGFVAVMISFVIGSMTGAIAGYLGGTAEEVIMRIIETILMIPSLLLTILLVYVLGASVPTLMIALGLSTIPHFARTARASVMTVRSNEYVEAARALGCGHLHILIRHILPNAISPILVQATSRVASSIMDAASFSFLGLGVPVPLPEWGSMMSVAKDFMREHPYLILFPGLALLITVLAVNLIGDGLRDAFDPKLKR